MNMYAVSVNWKTLNLQNQFSGIFIKVLHMKRKLIPIVVVVFVIENTCLLKHYKAL